MPHDESDAGGRMRIWKMNGAGNAFAVFDARERAFAPTEEQLREIAETMSADQIMAIETDLRADAFLRFWNADGSEVSQCGNGARCFAKFVLDRELTNKRIINVETKRGSIQLRVLDAGLVTVDMGSPSFEPQDLPFAADPCEGLYSIMAGDTEYFMTPVSVGNPHSVIKVDQLLDEEVARVGALIECHERFPRKVNVGFMQVISPDEINLRVYERGVGETQACGSGACGAVAVGINQGLLAEYVTVQLPGGELQISWQGPGSPLYMTGPATHVFDGQLSC